MADYALLVADYLTNGLNIALLVADQVTNGLNIALFVTDQLTNGLNIALFVADHLKNGLNIAISQCINVVTEYFVSHIIRMLHIANCLLHVPIRF